VTTLPLTIRMADDRVMRFPVEVRQGAPAACFAMGVRKSGSSVFSSIVAALARFNDWSAIDIPGAMFDEGYRWSDWNGHPRVTDLLWRGNAYLGFRDPPTAFYRDPVFREGRKLLMIRDPRDALVSEYFSNAYSHALPGQGDGSVVETERVRARHFDIETYVLGRAVTLNQTIAGYLALLDDPELLLLRYEDVIFDKPGWIRAVAAHFGWSVTDQLVAQITGWADRRPEVEDPTAFVRRVAPGDHRDKLSPAAIARLEAVLAPVWGAFGYGF
jgi:hypothetical protein